MAPKAKARARSAPKAKARAEPKAKAEPSSPAAGTGLNAARDLRAKGTASPSPQPAEKAAAAASSGEAAREKTAQERADARREKCENLLHECLEEADIARTDGRVLDIAVSEARLLPSVDKALLARAEKRLEEFHEFEKELHRRAEELRAKKDEVLQRHEEENEAFADAYAGRTALKAKVDELFSAVEDSDMDGVKKYLAGCKVVAGDGLFPPPPLPIDVEDHEGNTPLSEAACYGEVEIVEFLIASGAHINVRNSNGKTPLWRATYNGHDEVVKLLIDCGADASIENSAGEPPGKFGTASTKALIAAWDAGQMDERREGLTALQRLERPWPRLLLEASQKGDAEAAVLLAKAVPMERSEVDGARGMLRMVVDFENVADALWTGCANGHLELCRALLEERADPDSSSVTGLSCLMIACRKGYTAIASELMKRGARTHLRSQQGRLASDYAREAGDSVHDMVVKHCREVEDWSTMEEEARQSSGHRACNREALEGILDGRKNAGASDAATAALRALPAEELREGGDRYRRLLEERALADVLGLG